MSSNFTSSFIATVDGVPIGVTVQSYHSYGPLSPGKNPWYQVMGSQGSPYIAYVDYVYVNNGNYNYNGELYFSEGVNGALFNPLPHGENSIVVTGSSQLGTVGDIMYGVNNANFVNAGNFVQNLKTGLSVGPNVGLQYSVPLLLANDMAVQSRGGVAIRDSLIHSIQDGNFSVCDGSDVYMISNRQVNENMYGTIFNKTNFINTLLTNPDAEIDFGEGYNGSFFFEGPTGYLLSTAGPWGMNANGDAVLFGPEVISISKGGDGLPCEVIKKFPLQVSEDIIDELNISGYYKPTQSTGPTQGLTPIEFSGFSVIPQKVFGILLPVGVGLNLEPFSTIKTAVMFINSAWEILGQILIDDGINSTHRTDKGEVLLLGVKGAYEVDVFGVNISTNSSLTNYGIVLPNGKEGPYTFSDIREIMGGTIYNNNNNTNKNKPAVLGHLL